MPQEKTKHIDSVRIVNDIERTYKPRQKVSEKATEIGIHKDVLYRLYNGYYDQRPMNVQNISIITKYLNKDIDYYII